MSFETFDVSHLVASSPVAAVIYYVAVRVLKPLLKNYLDGMTNAITENTKAIKDLTESEMRASRHNQSEHSQISTHLELLTDTLLKANGHPPATPERELTKEEKLERRLESIEKFLAGDTQ